MLPVVFGLFLGTILVGVPVAFAMGIAGATWILVFEGIEPSILARRVYNAVNSFPLLAIPLFIIIGHMAERSGMLPDLVRWLQLLLGRMRGGMAYINVVGSMTFAGVSGTAVSDVASLGRVEIEMMRQAGYPVPYSAALTAVSSILAPLIPPSVAMIIYALAAGNVSIGGLFMAGVLPGAILAAGLLVMCWFKARTGDFGTLTERAPARVLALQTLKVVPLLMLPVIIVGGIIGGVFTATESAAIGVMYTTVIGFVVTRRLTLKDVYDAVVYSAVISSVLGMLMGTGQIVSWILTRHRVTQQLAETLMLVTTDPMLFMAIVAIALLLLGMIIDETAMIVALAPLLAPIAARYGIDQIQFGVIFVMCCLIGLIMPPIALILFMTSAIAKISLEAISLAILPFVAWAFVVLALLIVFPPLTLWLPRLLGF